MFTSCLHVQPFGLFQYIFSYACKTQLQSHSTLRLFCIYSCLDKSTHQYSLILNKCTLSSSWILVLSSDSFNFLHKFSLTLLDDYFTSLSNIHLYHSLLLLFWSLKKKIALFFLIFVFSKIFVCFTIGLWLSILNIAVCV